MADSWLWGRVVRLKGKAPMGEGIQAAALHAPEHAALINRFKEELLIVFLKQLKALGHDLVFPVAEVDDTAQDMVAFSIRDGAFRFELRKKD